MEIIFFTICNIIYYSFIYYVLYSFSFFAQLNSSIFLLSFSLLLTLPPFSLIYITKKDRKKFFIISSIYTILISILLYNFTNNILLSLKINSGLANFIVYLYKYLFLFSPIIAIYLVSIHKVFKQKKQLIFLIASKYILPIILGFIFMHFINFTHLLWLLSALDLITTLFSVVYASKFKI